MPADHPAAPSASELRWFGLLLAAVFGGVVWWQTEADRIPAVLWGVGGFLGIVYYLAPPLRRPMYVAWMSLVAPFGLFISKLVLGLIYFGIITPIGRVMALFGRDKLERRKEPERATYWIPHSPADDSGRCLRQS